MTAETIFSKIIRQEIPTPLLYQDELVTAFRDIAPRVSTHILIVPNKHIATINDVTDEDELTMGRMISVAKKLAKEEGMFLGNSAGAAAKGLLQLKDKFTKDDVVVVLFHDHGSRYVGKMYNNDWMKEMGYLD